MTGHLQPYPLYRYRHGEKKPEIHHCSGRREEIEQDEQDIDRTEREKE